MSAPNLSDCQPYFDIFAYSAVITTTCLALAFAFVAFFAIKNQCATCLKSIVVASALANAMIALRVVPTFRESFVIETASVALYHFFTNNAYWMLSGKYLMVVRGNKHVMKGEAIPESVALSGLKILFAGLAINSIVPIAYGTYLYRDHLDPYAGLITMSPQEFSWFIGFSAVNCSVQLVDGLLLVSCILIARA